VELAAFSDRIENELNRLADDPAYSPVLVCWMLVNSTHIKGRTVTSEALGEKAPKRVRYAADAISSDSAIKVKMNKI